MLLVGGGVVLLSGGFGTNPMGGTVLLVVGVVYPGGFGPV